MAGHHSVTGSAGEPQLSAFGAYGAPGVGYQCAEEQAAPHTVHYVFRDDLGLIIYDGNYFSRTDTISV